jgi:hypothetical protein
MIELSLLLTRMRVQDHSTKSLARGLSRFAIEQGAIVLRPRRCRSLLARRAQLGRAAGQPPRSMPPR